MTISHVPLYDRFLKRCPECDARQTFIRGKVKLVGGKKRRDKRGSISCDVFDRYPLGEGGNIRERAFL